MDCAEIDDLWNCYLDDPCDELRNMLIEHYMPLVHMTVSRMGIAKVLPRDELISYGSIGLMDAIRGFDPARGVKFTSYATLRIKGAVLDAVRNGDTVSRIRRSELKKVDRAEQELMGRLGRVPTEDELAAHAGFKRLPEDTTPRRIEDIAHQYGEAASGDEVIQARVKDVDDRLHREDLLRVVLSQLSERDQTIVLGYYYDGLTMREIGEVLSVTESAISQRMSVIERLLRAKADTIDAAFGGEARSAR